MDKAAFLVRLQKNIGMLDDEEQKDIIDEYAQHIDMKVSEGMSEDEAIEDFGNFEDFVREVLSAYHVKAPFDQAAPSGDGADRVGTVPLAREAARGAARAGVKVAGDVVASARCGARRLGEIASRMVMGASSSVRGAVVKASDSTDAVLSEDASGEHGAFRDAAARSSRPGLAGTVLEGCGAICIAGARWMWNGAVAVAVASMGLFALLCLFSIGVGAVLLGQGYPVFGLTIVATGVSACALACTYLISRLFMRKGEVGGSRPKDPMRTPPRGDGSMEGKGSSSHQSGPGGPGGVASDDWTGPGVAPETTDGEPCSTPSQDDDRDSTLPLGSRGGAHHA